jgi:orotidine-5'-phosphate decarboxylase
VSYLAQLKARYEATDSLICMGFDPVLERIPLEGNALDKITQFYGQILAEMEIRGIFPALIKPNVAYFEQYGLEGWKALESLIPQIKALDIPVLLDAKRGDIGRSSKAYATAVFEHLDCDAVTVSPYMGEDSLQPFFDYLPQGKGVYVLVRTSNPGASDFQDLVVDGLPLYLRVAEKLIDWHQPGLSAVVGATGLAELENLLKLFQQSEKTIPLLLPGVGAQGAFMEDVLALLRRGDSYARHRLNASSSLNYAWEKNPENPSRFARAAVDALEDLTEQSRDQSRS